MFGKLGDSFTALLAVSRFGFGVSWLLALALAALWTCYCSLRTFSDLALVFTISPANFCLQFAGLMMRRWPEIESLVKHFGIRFGCVTLVVSWCCLHPMQSFMIVPCCVLRIKCELSTHAFSYRGTHSTYCEIVRKTLDLYRYQFQWKQLFRSDVFSSVWKNSFEF